MKIDLEELVQTNTRVFAIFANAVQEARDALVIGPIDGFTYTEYSQALQLIEEVEAVLGIDDPLKF